MKKTKNFVLGLGLLIFLIIIAGLLVHKYFQNVQQLQTKTKYNEWIRKKHQAQQLQAKRFTFRNKQKYVSNPDLKNFWTQKQIPQNLVLPKNWNIKNCLDYFWPKWSKYFIIDQKILTKRVQFKNIITFQIKPQYQRKILKKNINVKTLRVLNISPQTLKVKKQILDQLIQLLRKPISGWQEISQWIQNHFPPKVSTSLQKKLKAHLYKFEWADF